MQLTDEQLATWRRDGSIVVPNVLSPGEFCASVRGGRAQCLWGTDLCRIPGKMGGKSWRDSRTLRTDITDATIGGPNGKSRSFFPQVCPRLISC